MQKVYVDEKTSLEIRPLNFDDKEDVKFFIQGIRNAVSQLLQYSAEARVDSFYGRLYFVYMYLGLNMRTEHLEEKEEHFTIRKNGKVVGTGWVSETTIPTYFYPVICAYELSLPWTSLTVDMHTAMARMMKARGHSKIYAQIVKTNPLHKLIPFYKIGEAPLPPRKPVLDFGEVVI